ncbi:hypothetical protein FRB90_000617 [Tulasnella sp. 427]|nr:hypothetical protein FRB90_000617 [Tulasnella sp. 427]
MTTNRFNANPKGPAPMASIHSLPPEIIMEIFEIITNDPGVFDHTPSWRHYDLSLEERDRDRPWPAPSAEASHNAEMLILPIYGQS